MNTYIPDVVFAFKTVSEPILVALAWFMILWVIEKKMSQTDIGLKDMALHGKQRFLRKQWKECKHPGKEVLGAERGSGGARNSEVRPGVTMHACNPGVGEVEAGGRIRFQARLCCTVRSTPGWASRHWLKKTNKNKAEIKIREWLLFQWLCKIFRGD